MRSMVAITKWGDAYIADSRGKFGGGYSGCPAGRTPAEAAGFTAREYRRYCLTNPEGGDLICPPEVRAELPNGFVVADAPT